MAGPGGILTPMIFFRTVYERENSDARSRRLAFLVRTICPLN